MKKLITTLVMIIGLSMVTNVITAKKPQKGDEKQTATAQTPRKQKFILLGHVDANIADSCYNIYITNVHNKITNHDLVACVPVKDKAFRYEIEIEEIMAGRIRAIFPGDNLCSAWIDLYFIPGLTLDMTVHNGYYTIHNENEYKAEVKEWQFYYPEQPPRYNNTIGNSTAIGKPNEKVTTTDTANRNLQLKTALDAYQNLLDDLKEQLEFVSTKATMSIDIREKEINRISDQIEDVTKSMKQLIDKYARSID